MPSRSVVMPTRSLASLAESRRPTTAESQPISRTGLWVCSMKEWQPWWNDFDDSSVSHNLLCGRSSRRFSTRSSVAFADTVIRRIEFMTISGHHVVMTTAKVSELKAKLSAYLAEVRAGGRVVVYDRNIPIAQLVPF